MAVKQTAGRDQLGEFAPKFAELNDDVLFGEVWSREDALSLRDRSLVTIVSLMSQGLIDSSFEYHLATAKKNGITKTEIAEIVTHAAFYMGWPKAWAVFRTAKEIWVDENVEENGKENAIATNNKENANDKGRAEYERTLMFPIGNPNNGFAQYFIGQSYLAPVSSEQVSMFNVTFEPGCRNNWHIHHADMGGGQMLICVGGRGWYQEWGKPARELHPGDIVNIPAGVKHWHGAASDSWFSHLAIEVEGENTFNEWLEPVDDDQYKAL